MEKNMKKIVFTFALVVAVCVGAAMSISAHEHRFNFRTIIFPDDTFTQTLGINDFDTIAGYHGTAVNKGFVFSFPNNFTLENFPNSAQTQVIGINNKGNTDGFYIDAAGVTHGLIDIHDTFTTIDFPNATSALTQLLGLNDTKDAAGYWQDAAGTQFPVTLQFSVFTGL